MFKKQKSKDLFWDMKSSPSIDMWAPNFELPKHLDNQQCKKIACKPWGRPVVVNKQHYSHFCVIKGGVHQFYKFVLKCKVRYTDTAVICDFPQIC